MSVLDFDESDRSVEKSGAGYLYGSWLIQHNLVCIILPILFCLFAISGAIYLQSTPDNRIFFRPDNPQLKALEEMEATFSKNDNAFIALEATQGDIFNPRFFSAILELTERGWQAPYSNRVDSLSNFQLTEATDDSLVVRDLIESDVELDQAYADQVRRYVMAKPALLNRMVSLDGRVTGVNINVLKPDDNKNAVFEVVQFARELVAEMEIEYPDINFYLTGGTAYDVAFSEIPASDNLLLGPLMFLLILLIVGLSLRSFWCMVAVVLLIGLVVGATMGLTGWVGASLNAGTAGAPVILLTLSVAYCVHVLVTMRQQMIAGMTQKNAIVETLRINLVPVAITSITTAIGFMSLNFSDAPPFRQLGNMVATGVLITFVLSVTLLPAFFCRVRLQAPGKKAPASVLMGYFCEFVIARRRWLLLIVGAGIVLLSLGSLKIVLDDNFIDYFDSRYRIRQDTDFIESNLTGMNALEYPVPAASTGGVSDPEYLRKIEAFELWLRQQPGVTNTVSITEVIKDLNQSMHGDDPEWHRLPESRELTAQYFLLYEMSLPYGMDLTNQVDYSKSISRVVALVRDASSADLRLLNHRAEQWLVENIPGREVKGSGLSLIFAYISGRNINSMLFGSLMALVGISFILIVALRSWRIGLLSLVPNLVPAAMALGVWGYMVGTAGLSVAIVVAVTLGIVVDDTVHFLSKYLRARRELGLTSEDAVRYTFKTVGVALWITSITLIAGFFVLFRSGFKVTAEMGLLSAVTIALALVADFLFLPPLLMQFDKQN